MEQLAYRSGTKADKSEIQRLIVAAYGQYSHLFTPGHRTAWNKGLHNEENVDGLLERSRFFVCETEGKLVGMAFLLPSGNPTDIYPADWSYIRMVGVQPGYEGRGIARTLTTMCMEEAQRLGETTIALHTSEFMDAARHIYGSLGFREVKEIPERFGKKYWLFKRELES
jgi:ribosomal protein S18 acetylase RimI-like enzyme